MAGQSGEKERAWTRLQGSGLRGNCDQNILYKKLFSIKKKTQSEVSLVCTEIFVHGVRLRVLPLLRTHAQIL